MPLCVASPGTVIARSGFFDLVVPGCGNLSSSVCENLNKGFDGDSLSVLQRSGWSHCTSFIVVEL